MTPPAETALQAVVDCAAIFEMSRIEIFSVGGADALRYSHGRITQNVKSLAPGEARKFMLLSPQGRVSALGNVVRAEEGSTELLLLVESDTEDGSSFPSNFLQFKVSDDVTLKNVTQDFQVFCLLGSQAGSYLKRLLAKSATETNLIIELEGIALRIIKTSGAGIDSYIILAPTSSAKNLSDLLREATELSLFSEQEFEVIRISYGIPSVNELSEKSIATEYPYSEYISFDKGCYTGQEVVEMSIARGRPNRSLLALAANADSPLAPGTTLVSADQTNCGKLTSSCYLEKKREARFLAFVKSSVPESEQLFVGKLPCCRLSIAGHE